MSDLFSKNFADQLKYKEIGLTTGSGVMTRTKHGAFVIYSRISIQKILEAVKEVKPIQSLEELKTIFLLGPTPQFFGENKATTSWRRDFVDYIDEHLNDSFLIVLPEPFNCDWKLVDYPGLNKPEQHIYAQVHWEDYFINLAAKTGILVLHAHFMWKGNAGPTVRLEAGKLFVLMKEDKVNAAVLNLPIETQTAHYIGSHLLDAQSLYERGRFEMTSCSPLKLDANNNPVDKDGKIVEAGIYPNGSIESGCLDEFFRKIVEMTTKI